MSREELEIQFKRRDFIILQRGSLELAERKGREVGRQEGMEKAREDVARNLLDILDDATIAARTGLSPAQVSQLRSMESSERGSLRPTTRPGQASGPFAQSPPATAPD